MVVSCEKKDAKIPDEDETEISLKSEIQLSFEYTVKPGTEAWYMLETEQERIDALQVPENVLAMSSPEEIVRLCITFPSFGHFTAWNTPQDGFNVMLDRYNILRTLLTRKDTGGSSIAAYKDAGMTGFRTLPCSNEFWTLKLLYLELILSQKEILQSMSPEEKLELMTEARLKFFEKFSNESFSSLPEELFTLRIMVSILEVDDYPELMAYPERQTITEFINTGWLTENGLKIEVIGEMIDNYSNSKNFNQ